MLLVQLKKLPLKKPYEAFKTS